MPVPNVYEQGEALRDAMYTHGRQKSGDILTNLLARIDEMAHDLNDAADTLVKAGERYSEVVQENEFLKGSLASCGRLISEVSEKTNLNADDCHVCAEVQLLCFKVDADEPEEGSDDSK